MLKTGDIRLHGVWIDFDGAVLVEDYTGPLRQLMNQVGLHSFRSLTEAAGVSDWTIQQIRRGQINALRLEVVLKVSQALQVPLNDLLAQLSPAAPSIGGMESSSNNASTAQVEQLQQEYKRLQLQMEQQRESLRAEFQAEALTAIEAWLLQWPTAAYAAQQNPQVPAIRLIPLMQPLERLLTEWEVRAIASVGSEVPYDPQLHQMMEGTAQPGDLIRIRYTGYWHGDKLLHRAKVSPVSPNAPK
ncbi:MAG TPA: helix-turn-helix domain-containing protein [Leptolyngbyaceae cyanobacterium]